MLFTKGIAVMSDANPTDEQRHARELDSLGVPYTGGRPFPSSHAHVARLPACRVSGPFSIREDGGGRRRRAIAAFDVANLPRNAGFVVDAHWLSLLPLRLNPIFTGRLSCADWHSMQVLTPGSTRRRASGISSPHSWQWVSATPVGMRARALMTPSVTVSSI